MGKLRNQQISLRVLKGNGKKPGRMDKPDAGNGIMKFKPKAGPKDNTGFRGGLI